MRMSNPTHAAALIGLAMLAAASWGCSGASAPAGLDRRAAGLVGVDPIPRVHLFENHSSALIVWRREEARDRILVHLDGHADMDWLPDETVARIAAARPEELASLELHPYALDNTVHERFGIWNFVYPAARLGVVREFWWVVPDGTLADPASARRLVKEILIDKLEMITVDEAAGFRLEGRTVRGVVLGVPTVLCELRDLPAFDEPVLLDIDLDYFTTLRSRCSGKPSCGCSRCWAHPSPSSCTSPPGRGSLRTSFSGSSPKRASGPTW